MNKMKKAKWIKDVEKEENEAKKTFIAIIFITILVISVISLSFAVLRNQNKNGSINTIKASNISMNYTESLNGISINNALPISDSVGKVLSGKGEYFDFTIKTTIVGKRKVSYQLSVEKDKNSTLADSDIKLYLEQQINGTYEPVVEPTLFVPIKEKSEFGSPVGTMVLKTVTKQKSGFDNYRLRMWIKEDASIPSVSQNYTVRVNVYGSVV